MKIRTMVVLLVCFVLATTAQAEWLEHSIPGTISGTYCICLADIDNDEDLDIVGGGDWFENLNSGEDWVQHDIGNFTDWCTAIDFDGDGDLDVIGSSPSSPYASWWENPDSVDADWVQHTISQTVPNQGGEVFDFDNDGDLDVFGCTSWGQAETGVYWHEYTPEEPDNWIPHEIDHSWHYHDACSLDVNLDGHIDIAAAHVTNGLINWWENDGSGQLGGPNLLASSFGGAHRLHVCDMDGDEYPDIVGTAMWADEIAWWRNVNGGSSWSKTSIQAGYDAYGLDVVDLDDDGDLDVLSTGYGTNKVTWFTNLGSLGTDWDTPYDFTTNMLQPKCVISGDLDGDGDVDVLASNASGILWWEQPGQPGPDPNEPLVIETWEDGNWTLGPSWFETGSLSGIEMVLGGYCFSDWSVGLFTDQQGGFGALSIALQPVPEFAIDFWVKKRPNLVNNYFSVEVSNGATSFDSGIRFEERGDHVEVFWQGSSLGTADIDMSLDRWYPVLMQRYADGSWEFYFDNLLKFSGVSDQFTSFDNPVFTISGYGSGDEGGILVDDIIYYDSPQTPPTADGLISDLVDAVDALYDDGVLNRGQHNSLIVKLEGAQKKFDRGQYHVSVNMLEAFINQVTSFIDESVLTPEQGGPLICMAYQAISIIEGTYLTAHDASVFQSLPQSYAVSHAYPNPFNPSTVVNVSLPESADLTVIVFNVTGQQVAVLAQGRLSAGEHAFTFDATNVASGLYFIRTTVLGQLNQVEKVILVR